MAPNLATMAQYYRIGIEAGVLEESDARDWAWSVVALLDCPPGEIIEITWRKPCAQLLDDLNQVPGEVDLALVGGWLLAGLGESLDQSDEDLVRKVGQAMQVVRLALMGESVIADFDWIDDGLHLAYDCTIGSMAECRRDFVDALASFPVPPFERKKI